MAAPSSLSEGIVVLDRPFASPGRRIHRAHADEFVTLTVQKAAALNTPPQAAVGNDDAAQMRITVGDIEHALVVDLRAGAQVRGLPVSRNDEVWVAVTRPNAFLVYGHRSPAP